MTPDLRHELFKHFGVSGVLHSSALVGWKAEIRSHVIEVVQVVHKRGFPYFIYRILIVILGIIFIILNFFMILFY